MKKIKIYALVLVLVLGCLGAAYAAWVDELKVNGRVEAGNIDVYFKDAKLCFDGDDKDIVDADVEIIDDKKLKVTIKDFYPCVDGYLSFRVHNRGSVPVVLENMDIKLRPEDKGLTLEQTEELPKFCKPSWWNKQETLKEGVQLGQSNKAQKALYFNLDQFICEDKDTQDMVYEFTVTLDFIQYNKYEK